MSTWPFASGHARSKWLSIDGASRQFSRRVNVVLCVVTHSFIFALSSLDRSAQFLCFFRQPWPSLPDAPWTQTKCFVAYPRHTSGSGHVSMISPHFSLSRTTPLAFLTKPLVRTSIACSSVNLFRSARVPPSFVVGFALSCNVCCYTHYK